ncbi:hypothetical protein K458DRAFT_45234 [Lentithecium fluviatile CBS 122367]|uniref:Uncharacterized protein n=1 Tax=Lentithecium fluviatile CBS 122367 TaxID=1168545 RepID=A0A6G1IZH8_9PLEO|nr:hypothetical protein K458DRAFT_45234 [Lentithecium fluviatile CBS 122367]
MLVNVPARSLVWGFFVVCSSTVTDLRSLRSWDKRSQCFVLSNLSLDLILAWMAASLAYSSLVLTPHCYESSVEVFLCGICMVVKPFLLGQVFCRHLDSMLRRLGTRVIR